MPTVQKVYNGPIPQVVHGPNTALLKKKILVPKKMPESQIDLSEYKIQTCNITVFLGV